MMQGRAPSSVLAPVLRAVDEVLTGALAGLVAPGVAEGDASTILVEATRDAVNGLVNDALRKGQAAIDRVSDRVDRSVWGALHNPVDLVVEGALGGDEILYETEDNSYSMVGYAAQLVTLRRDTGTDWLRGAIDAILRTTRGRCMAGPLLARGLSRRARISFLLEVCRLELPDDLRDRNRAYEQTLESGCMWYAHRDFLIACERPRAIHREITDPRMPRGRASHRLHRIDGPAISWPDGWGVHVIHGRRVPAWIVEHPECITVHAIESEHNAEVRRLMIERYSWARYMTDSGAQVIDEAPADHPIAGLRGARLLRKELPGEPEPIVYLEMVNSTPEQHGTYRRYLERIDPKLYGGDAGRLCHAAMASRWRYRDCSGRLQLSFSRWQDYCPSAES
jgi:hypothetical protein